MRLSPAMLGLISLCPAMVPSVASGVERLAVLELSGEALSVDKRAYLARRVRAELKSLLPAGTEVVTRENMQALVDASAGECIEEGSCAVETLRNLGADKGVEGSLVRFGRELRLHLNLYDSGSGALIRSSEARGLDEQALAEALPDACARLLGLRHPTHSMTGAPLGARPVEHSAPWDTVGLVSLAVGAMALVGSIVLGVQASSTQDELRASPHLAAEATRLQDEGRSQAAVADTVALGGVVAVAYGVWRVVTE